MARTRCFIFIVYILIPSYAIENEYNINSNSIFHNEFAVHIPAGGKVADEIASKYGYQNMGQIGSLENFYLFNHNRIRKRSAEPSTEYHQELSADPQVAWAEQQIEQKRVKRDFSHVVESHDKSPSFVRSLIEEIAGEQGETILHRERRQFFPNSFTNGFGRFSIFKAPQLNVSPIRRGSRRFPDPLYADQWYLSEGAIGGHDMNVSAAWAKGYTGKGVVISILDDGIQHNHPDLAQNYDPQASTDINDNDADPMPRDNGDNKHGTRCAGEVASVAFNDFCGVGIAYNASIGGVRMLDGTVNDAVEARAISLNPDHIDIYSASWGPEDDGKTVDGPGPLAKRAFINGVIRGRHGKGSIFVWASGNGGRHTDNCNCDGYTNSIFTLSISSASQRGLKPWYLEECSSTLASTYSSGTPGLDRSVATADMDGSLRGDRICTTDHTGTSASAPLAAGLCALALEANPDLSWRDMQHLVVRTSRMEPLHQEEGWFINGVGRHVSHKFGYGLMDAGAIVELAEKWTTVPPQHVCQTVIDRTDLTIPTIRGSAIQAEIITDGCAGTSGEVRYLEHVQAVVSLRFLPRGNINIRLISPSGTSSTLLFERPRDVLSEKFDDWPFLSVHFWGEKAAGSWRLLVTNAGSRQSSHPGVLVRWQLILHGTRENPERLRFGSNQFSPSFNQFGDLIFAGSVDHRVYDALNSSSSREKEVSLLKTLNKSKEKETFSTELCHSECLGGCFGTGPENCKACKHFSLQNECVSACQEGTYGADDKDCLPCHGSCAQCSGPRQNQCITCPSQTLFVEHMGLCVDTCPVGYYAGNGSCLPCSNQCAECNSSSTCLRCDHHLLLYNGSCHTVCPRKTFEGLVNTCQKCNSTCDTCVGESDEDCASCCKSLSLSRGKCLSECPKGTYKDESFGQCIPCQIGCSSCTEATCMECEKGWRLKSGICVAYLSTQCDINEFRNGTSCTPCHSACLNCIGPNEKECLQCLNPNLLMGHKCIASCPEGSFIHLGRCLSCPHGCSSCSDEKRCLTCSDKFHLNEEKCLASCPLEFYSDRGKCVHCDASCGSCWGPMKDQCFTCPSGSLLLDSSCRSGCPEGFFQTNDTCLPCYHNCRDCDGPGLHSCISCREFLTLDGGMCLECRSGRYYNTTIKTCAPCNDSCLSCNGMDENSCTACQAPFSLHPATRSCRICCQLNVSEDIDGKCCACDNSTNQCIGSGITDKRRIALSLPDTTQPLTSVSFFSSTSALVVTICLVNVIVFGAVFVLLQVRSSRRRSSSYSYKRLPLVTSSIPQKISQTSLTMTSLGGSDEDSEGDDECDELFTRT